ncbi:long-chain-fatty-acid--CoA ligase [Blastomonas sp.]|uniref:long-chain-fatty-acid--CoA ligase n=1 Tax=Blastomonas sp. TaxID=1909299 RepID=UPI00406A93A8
MLPAGPFSDLSALLEATAAVYPDRPALDFMGRRWTYGELDAAVKRAATGLMRLGVAPGDRVALCLPNTPHFVIAYFATLRVGGVVVSINPLYSDREMHYLIGDCGARHIFVPDLPEVFGRVSALGAVEHIIVCPMADILPPLKRLVYRALKRDNIARPGKGDGRITVFADLAAPIVDVTPARPSPKGIAVLQYTGGTTGMPKGAMLTHQSLLANCLQTAAHDAGRGDRPEVVMGVLPLFHVFALTTVLNYSVYTASCIILLPRFEMKAFLAAMRRTVPDRLYVVPTILTALNLLPEAALPPMDQLRLCVSGGAPLPAEVRAAFEQRTGVRVLEGYGLSEASPIISCNPVSGENRDGSAGLAFADTEIEVRSLETGVAVAATQIGEICVRGPQLMRGYWNRPEDTREVLVDGWLRTGDVGYLDRDGYLFLVDRIKDLILCGGYNVYPRVIEDALYEHPDVIEAIVVGVPDPYRGEAPKAFIRLRDGALCSSADLRQFLSARISKIELPREIEIRDELPRTLIGKLSKNELREAELEQPTAEHKEVH